MPFVARGWLLTSWRAASLHSLLRGKRAAGRAHTRSKREREAAAPSLIVEALVCDTTLAAAARCDLLLLERSDIASAKRRAPRRLGLGLEA